MSDKLERLAEAHASSRLDSLIATIAERLGAEVKIETVFGTPIERDGVLIVPVARARWGFGAGGGSAEDRDGGGGGGGGIDLSPAGFIELRGGRARFRPVFNPMQFVLTIGVLVLLALSVWRALPGTRS